LELEPELEPDTDLDWQDIMPMEEVLEMTRGRLLKLGIFNARKFIVRTTASVRKTRCRETNHRREESRHWEVKPSP
jgi:hypothetical protein